VAKSTFLPYLRASALRRMDATAWEEAMVQQSTTASSRVAGSLFTMMHHTFVYTYIAYPLTVKRGSTFHISKGIFLIVGFSACSRNTKGCVMILLTIKLNK